MSVAQMTGLEPLFVGAAIAYGGVLLGRAFPRRTPSKTPKPICGCSHHLAQHDPATGECHQQVKVSVNAVQKMVGCTCKQYVGPVPAELLLAQFQPRELP